ncbi:polysaccharide biosynthesis C-terminal domain-containing protein [Aureispira sp. CCB-QB1]|uniref:polysaccharide biosynthesis C-terminal domain-containing protein n=1 Tax=Aureispira sp. CCB-QB1 TaxID=1313421 RepID=UPI0006980CBC|nr:polysaccharide biosynthesis C-terminal domain-containing protein [Aureispira sp. CCB-QB1]
MNREFLLNLVFLILINLIIKPFYVFGIDLKVQNVVENYSLYFALLNFSYIFQIFSDLGIQQYNNRNIAQHDYLFDKYFPHILGLKGGLSLVFLFLSLSTALILGYGWKELYLLLFLLLNQIFITFTFFFRSNISGLQYYRLDSILSILDKLLMMLICIPLLWGPWVAFFQIEWFIYAQTAAFGLTAFISFALTRRYLKGKLVLYWNKPLLRAILKQSIPFSLVVLLMNIYTRIDAVMIERLLYDPVTNKGIQEGNIYAAAYRLLDAINMICFLFAGLLLPMFARMLKNKEDVQPLLKLSSSIMLVITVSFSIAVCFYAQEIMPLLYVNYSPSMSEVLILLMIGFNSIGMIHIVGTLLTANGNLMSMNIVFVVGIVINMCSNYFLILEYGAWGAAISTIITQSFVALAELELARRTFNLSTNILFLGQILLFVIGVGLINWGLQRMVIPWFCGFVLAGICSVGWALITKIIDVRGILRVIKTKAA